MAQVCRLGRPSGAVLHLSCEPVVRRPCSDLMDMLQCLINCRIINIIIIIIIIIMYVVFVVFSNSDLQRKHVY